MDGIPLGSLGLGSGWALVCLFVILIARGDLVPRRTHEDATHDRDEWRTESRIKDQQLQEERDQKLMLLNELGPTFTKFLADMRSVVEARKDAG